MIPQCFIIVCPPKCVALLCIALVCHALPAYCFLLYNLRLLCRFPEPLLTLLLLLLLLMLQVLLLLLLCFALLCFALLCFALYSSWHDWAWFDLVWFGVLSNITFFVLILFCVVGCAFVFACLLFYGVPGRHHCLQLRMLCFVTLLSVWLG